MASEPPDPAIEAMTGVDVEVELMATDDPCHVYGPKEKGCGYISPDDARRMLRAALEAVGLEASDPFSNEPALPPSRESVEALFHAAGMETDDG